MWLAVASEVEHSCKVSHEHGNICQGLLVTAGRRQYVCVGNHYGSRGQSLLWRSLLCDDSLSPRLSLQTPKSPVPDKGKPA